MITTFWFAYLLAYSVGSNEFAPSTDAKAEIRILEVLGPHGSTKEECEDFSDKQRKRAFASGTYKIVDYRQLKYACAQLPLSEK